MLDVALTPSQRGDATLPIPLLDLVRTRVLGFVPPALDSDVRRIFRALALDVHLANSTADFATRVISYAPHLLLVDMDAPGIHADLVRTARALCSGVPVVEIVYCWSEREMHAHSLADALVHKPPRTAEWHAQLRRLGIVAPAAA
jgi:DNA-binding response OmpR family regulator